MDISLAIQLVTEEIFLKMARTAKEITGSKNIVLAGGVALNSVANGKLLKEKVFENIWVQPASGDAYRDPVCVDNLRNLRLHRTASDLHRRKQPHAPHVRAPARPV